MNERKPGVLLFTSSFPRWADDDVTGRFMIDIAVQMCKEFDVHVLAPWTRGSKREEILEGVHIHRHRQSPIGHAELAYGSGMLTNLRSHWLNPLILPFFFFFQLLAIHRLVRRHKVAILNPHWLIPQGVLAVFYRNLLAPHLKVVGTAHGSDINGLNGKLGNFLKKYVLRNLDGLTVVSEQLQDRVSTLGYAGPLTVVPMGVDTSKFNPNRRNPGLRQQIGGAPLLIYVGACIETKGLRYLIEAMPAVVRAFPKAKLLIIGEGNLWEFLNERSRELGLRENVSFLGILNHREIPNYLASADVFILPSFAEGFSVGVAEALSSGLPVIMTEGIGIADSIRRKLATGEKEFILGTPLKSTEALQERIISLLSKEDGLENVRQRGRQYIVEHYDWSVIGEKYRQALLSVTPEGSPR